MRVSIVIPALNGEKWIEQAVQSALDQDLTGSDGLPELYEVIVRDDGSTDGTLKILKAVQEKYPGKLRVVAGENCGGIGASFQAAFDLADTEFVCIMGQDDRID